MTGQVAQIFLAFSARTPLSGNHSSGAAEAILAFLREKNLTDHGGGGKFYGPEEWEDRGEDFGTGALLIVIHDGGEHAPAFNWDYEDYNLVEELRRSLEKVGVYVEQCTSWYSAVYPIRP